VFFTYCGKDKPTGPSIEERIELLLEEGWTLYSNLEYSDAVLKFEEVFELDTDYLPALLGRGWCYARLAFGSNDPTYNLAVNDFDQILIHDPENIDAKAGIAFILLVNNQYNDAINAANFVLEKDNNYVFSHDDQVSAPDLILLLAQAYYYLAKYDKAAEQLFLLDPVTTHPADDPEILLAQIQSLWGVV